MKSIVVYIIMIATGTLVLTAELGAQKPAIDLISTHQQYRHPEAIIDTGYAVNQIVADSLLIQAHAAANREPEVKERKKRHRQIGPSLDSIFQNRDNETRSREKRPVRNSYFNKKYNPIKIFLNIIALK